MVVCSTRRKPSGQPAAGAPMKESGSLPSCGLVMNEISVSTLGIAAPNVLMLRGATRWFSGMDEVDLFKSVSDKKKGGNSGVGLRTPEKGDPAYAGMEIQLIDDEGWPGKLADYQHTGSIYDVQPAKPAKNKPIGEWNAVKIVCDGRKVTVELFRQLLTEELPPKALLTLSTAFAAFLLALGSADVQQVHFTLSHVFR